jgi:hypothetical protein
MMNPTDWLLATGTAVELWMENETEKKVEALKNAD